MITIRKFLSRLKRGTIDWLNLMPIKIALRELRLRNRNREKPIKTYFLIYMPKAWDAMDSVYQACAADPAFEPHIIALPKKNRDGSFAGLEATCQFFDKMGYPYQRGQDENGFMLVDLRHVGAELVFYQSPYPEHLHDGFHFKILCQYARIAYISYFLILTEGQIGEFLFSNPFIKKAWKVFVETKFQISLFDKYLGRAQTKKKIVHAGYPKFDSYNGLSEHNNFDAAAYWPSGSDKKKRLLWCPHWSIINPALRSSTFLKYCEHLYDFAQRHQNTFDLVLRPHPLLFEEVVKSKALSDAALKTFLEKFEALPNARIDETEERYFAVFDSSDALISDTSSFLGEYLITKKPILYTHDYESDDTNLNPLGEALLPSFYIADTKAKLEDHLNNIFVNGQDPKAQSRAKAYDDYLKPPCENVGRQIKDYLKENF